MKRQFALRSAAVLVCTLAVAATASGNGEVFFMPAATDQPVELAYVGRIKDSETGRPVTGVSITLTDKRSGLIFPFANDKPGHYRSPDIGASIKDHQRFAQIDTAVGEGRERMERLVEAHALGHVE